MDVEALSKQEVQALEPQVQLDVAGAVHYKCDAHLYPNNLVKQLIAHLTAAGVIFNTNTKVQRIITRQQQVQKVVTSKGEYEADIVVMAAGSWLPQLAKMAGISLSLMPGKGYSFTIDQPSIRLNIPAILCEARVAITPMNGKMRYGGTMEIGAVNNTVNMNRVKGIVELIPKYFSNMQMPMPLEKDIWYGFRPCTPDGLPYIGRSSTLKNLFIGGGHAMSGLSLGPVTGNIIAALANGQPSPVNINVFNVERFG